MKRLTLAGVLLVLVFLRPGDSTVEGQQLNEFVAAAAELRGMNPNDLKIDNQAEAQFPLTGVTLRVAKIYNVRTQESFGIALDEDGRTVQESAYLQAELEATSAKYGKLTPALYDALLALDSDAKTTVSIRIAFWPTPADVADTEEYSRIGPEAARSKYQEEQARLLREVAAAERPLVTHLTSIGVPVVYVDELVPLVTADMTKGEIDALQERDDVHLIDMDGKYSESLGTSRNTIHAQYWNLSGTGTKVAFVESGSIDTANPYLQGQIINRMSCPDDHVTGVAGVVGSDHPTYKGVAWDATLLWGGHV